jgi:hypothetical protein
VLALGAITSQLSVDAGLDRNGNLLCEAFSFSFSAAGFDAANIAKSVFVVAIESIIPPYCIIQMQAGGKIVT